MSKSSLDYAELLGLTLALENIKTENAEVAKWLKKRIKELEKK